MERHKKDKQFLIFRKYTCNFVIDGLLPGQDSLRHASKSLSS